MSHLYDHYPIRCKLEFCAYLFIKEFPDLTSGSQFCDFDELVHDTLLVLKFNLIAIFGIESRL
jgi:hypothetical protein